jgi:chloride channel protein, CIC family
MSIVAPARRVLRSQRLGLLGLSLVIGVGAGFGAVVFRYLIEGLTKLFTGFPDYAAHPGAANPNFPELGRWFVVFTPIVAGILYGPLVQKFASEARGHGVPEVMLAVARKGGRIRPQVAVVKALTSALCIGGGGSVGREGPIVQIGSALGSSLAQMFRMDERRIRLLLACGAAGGIAATFNAPLAGVFFAMELILRHWAAEAFGMLVISSVTASVIGRNILGDTPFLSLPVFEVHHLVEFPLYAVLGLVAGLVGVGFSRVLYAIEDGCDWAWRGPEWLRPAVGGVLLGGLLLVLPEMYGVGYPVLGDAVAGKYALGFLLVLLAGKMLACSLTIGIGGSGGVFAPSLFCGATLGAAFGEIVTAINPEAGTVGAYALVGMGAVFAGAARAPITAVVIMFELTGEYSIILPLMLAIVIATGVSHLVSHDTIYTRKLLRRGIDIDEPADAAAARRPISEVMGLVPKALVLGTDLSTAASAFANSDVSSLPVVDPDGRYTGVLTVHELMNALAAGEDTDLLALCSPVPTLRPTDQLGEAVYQLDRGADAVPVADDSDYLLGWVRHSDVLSALNPRLRDSGSGTMPVADGPG